MCIRDRGLGVKAELVQVQTATRTQFLISGKMCIRDSP